MQVLCMPEVKVLKNLPYYIILSDQFSVSSDCGIIVLKLGAEMLTPSF